MLPLLNRQWRALVAAVVVPVVVSVAALPLVSGPMSFFTHAAYILSAGLLQQLVLGNGVCFRLPLAGPVPADPVHRDHLRRIVAVVPPYRTVTAVLVLHLVGCAAAVVVAEVMSLAQGYYSFRS